MKYPHLQQHDETDCGAACLSMILEYYGAKYPLSQLKQLIKIDTQGTNFRAIIKGSEKLNLKTEALEGNMEELLDGISSAEVKLPFIARIINEVGFEHFVVVYKVKKDCLIIGDPAKASISKISMHEFEERWQQQILVFETTERFLKINARKFSFLKFWQYVSFNKKLFMSVFFLSIIITLINMSGSIVFQYVIENTLYVESSSILDVDMIQEIYKGKSEITSLLSGMEDKFDVIFANINTVCISIIILYLLKHLINVLRLYILSLTAKKMSDGLTLDYYNHLITLPFECYGRKKTGELISRFNDTEKIRSAISSITLTIMLDTIMSIGCGLVLYWINKYLFLLALGIMIIYAVIVILFRKPIMRYNHMLMEDDARVISYLKESIDGMETIKSYNYEKIAQDKTKELYGAFTRRNVKASFVYNLMSNLISFTQSVGIILLLWLGCALCAHNMISISELIIFYYLLDFFLEPLQSLVNMQPELQTAMVAAERLNDILDVEVEKNDKMELKDSVYDIHIEDVDFRYGERRLVLNGISMMFKRGEKTAIIGESGCGKTTIAKLLMSFYSPEKGKILVNNEDLQMFSPKSIRQRFAYVSQNVFLFTDTIYNNLRMGNEFITEEQIENICKMCCAHDFIIRLPLGYNTVLEENGTNLSNGQKQRLSIARALLINPDVIIFDEATSNLDVVNERYIKEMINKFSADIVWIIIAHRLSTIKDCDNIYLMKDGSVVSEGTHSELIEKSKEYKRILTMDEEKRI